jgi:deoxyribonuclease V
MRYQERHPWQVTPAAARRLQQHLRHEVKIGTYVQEIRYIAGADISVARFAPTVYAGVVVLDYASLEIVERKGVVTRTDFPYIPGLLSFREVPALLQVFSQLDITPDIVVCDGQGIAHPRGLGIASHLGLLLDVPTIGCAKSRLIGQHQEPAPTRGAHTPLFGTAGAIIGAVLRTKDNTKPVFVSVGHKMSLSQALNVLLYCGRGYRIPEPTRLADQYVGAMRRAHTTGDEDGCNRSDASS